MLSRSANYCDAAQIHNDLEELSIQHGLYLKPLAKVSITVQLPHLQSGHIGQSISNWEVIEKLRALARPTEFTQWRVIKSTLEFFRFQADLPEQKEVKKVIQRLNGSHIKLSGFPESLRVKASEAKSYFPRRHDWESFFRDAKDMNEMLPGERPDTIYLKGLPIRWFVDLNATQPVDSTKPSAHILKRVFKAFGEIRHVDIPMLSAFKSDSKDVELEESGRIFRNQSCIPSSGNLDGLLTFDAYIQYKEFHNFVRCMDALRGKWLAHCLSNQPNPIASHSSSLRTDNDATATNTKVRLAEIQVDFDRTKHLSDRSIDQRRLAEEKLQEQEKKLLKLQEEEKLRKEKLIREEEQNRLAELEKEERRKLLQADMKRKQAEQQKIKEKEAEIQRKILLEERKILVANRKLHSMRLLAELMQRVKSKEEHKLVEQLEKQLAEEKARIDLEIKRKEVEKALREKEREHRKRQKLLDKEYELRAKLLKKMRDSSTETSLRKHL